MEVSTKCREIRKSRWDGKAIFITVNQHPRLFDEAFETFLLFFCCILMNKYLKKCNYRWEIRKLLRLFRRYLWMTCCVTVSKSFCWLEQIKLLVNQSKISRKLDQINIQSSFWETCLTLFYFWSDKRQKLDDFPKFTAKNRHNLNSKNQFKLQSPIEKFVRQKLAVQR